MLRIVLYPFIVFGLIGAAIWLFLTFATPDAALLKQSTIDHVMKQAEAAPATGGLLDSLVAPGNSATDTRKELQSLQQNVLQVLLAATVGVLGLGLALSIGWGAYAHVREASVEGPKGQRSAFPAWALLIPAYAVASALLYFLALAQPTVDPSPMPYWGRLLAIALLGGLGYWIATALAASPTMRPSVPLARLLTKRRKAA